MSDQPPSNWGESPWRYETADHLGRKVRITIAFNTSTLAIVNPGLAGNREAGCLYDRIVLGRPDGAQKVFAIPEGDFNVGRAQLANQGYATIEEVAAANFTLGTQETPT